jgi:hypothetical protein
MKEDKLGFSEELKVKIRKKSHHTCCLCKSLGVEIHHIVPVKDGGPDTEDNAAPLCPSCHETYGGNPEKRKFLREIRDAWYEICAARFAGDSDRLGEISELLKATASKEDVKQGIDELMNLLKDVKAKVETSRNQEGPRQLGGMIGMTFGGVSAGRHCKKCGTIIGLMIGDQGRCPNCGTPW